MVAKYRWDFIGLSTFTKPTPETSEKVVNGSTYYCSDTSKLYVWCKDNWYERKPLGGGGGTTYTAGTGIDITGTEISVDTDTIQPKLTAGTNITIDSDNVISASGGGGSSVKTLTTADYNYPENNPNSVALWLLDEGMYYRPANVTVRSDVNTLLLNGLNTVIVGGLIDNDNKIIVAFGNVAENGIPKDISEFVTNATTGAKYEADSFVPYRYVRNNLTAGSAGYVLDARQGKELKRLIDELDQRVTALGG